MGKIKTADAILSREHIYDEAPPQPTTGKRKGVEIRNLKLTNLEILSLPIQPVSLIIDTKRIMK